MTATQQRRENRKYWLQRLNVLLRFARVDPWKLNDGALEKLLDEIHFAVVGSSRPPVGEQLLRLLFDRQATRKALSEAQHSLDRALQILLVKPTAGPREVKFKLAGQELTIVTALPPQEGEDTSVPWRIVTGLLKEDIFVSWFWSDHFPSQVYTAFAEMLKASGVKLREFLRCSHCDNLFVPLRKPRKGTPAYCSPGCASVIASRNYRKRQAAARLKKKRRKGK
jgi:hypothetical protein